MIKERTGDFFVIHSVVLGLLFCSVGLIASDTSKDKLKQETDDTSVTIQQKPRMSLEAYKELLARIESSPDVIKRHIASFYDSDLFIAWKSYYPVSADQHVEFTPDGRHIAWVARIPGTRHVEVRNVDTGAPVYGEQYTIYADPQRPHQRKSGSFECYRGPTRNTRLVKMYQPPCIEHFNVNLEHDFFAEHDDMPDALALNPDRTIFAVGTIERLYLYKRQLRLHELLEQN